MPLSLRARMTIPAIIMISLIGLSATACTSQPSASLSPSMPSTNDSSMPGMGMTTTDGLTDNSDGLTMTSVVSTLTADAAETSYQFQILGQDHHAMTSFQADQTKLMHFYLIRSDTSQFQHVHPTMARNGTWTASLAPLEPGSYRAYASFVPAGATNPIVLSKSLAVPGSASPMPIPTASTASSVTTADGYRVTVTGDAMMGMEHPLTVHISKDGTPVTDLEPYLATYAHLSAFNTRTLAFAHLHPEGTATTDHGGPTLTFHALFAEAGDWRLFIQFQIAGRLHTAPVTVMVK